MPSEPFDGAVFHAGAARIYDGDSVEEGFAATKRAEHMARVAYSPAHPNSAFPDDDARAGRGEAVATWIVSEQDGTAEGLFAAPFDLVHDTRLAPHAAIGLHVHDATEELYYVLEGAVTVTTTAPDGRTHTATLGPGDAHAVRRGQAHHGEAGPDGCRMIVVAVRVG